MQPMQRLNAPGGTVVNIKGDQGPAGPPGTAAPSIAFYEAVEVTATAAGQPMVGGFPVAHSGPTQTTLLLVIGQTIPGSGESVTIDVKRNGVSVLSSPLVANHSSVSGAVDVSSHLLPGTRLSAGDELTADLTYVAGGSPTNPNLKVALQWS